MNIFPIISHELRAEARHPANYALRTLGAGILTVVFGIVLLDQVSPQSGGTAFLVMSFIVFCGIWIVVPILTADCLSREKREGTLGLLFLTPLKPFEIILGKGAIHAIRSLTLIIAVVPVVTIPFVLGGITRSNVFASLILDSVALLLSLAAGLLASSLCRQWTRAIILAEIFAFLFFMLFLRLAIAPLGWVGAGGSAFGQLSDLLQAAYYSSRYTGFGKAAGVLPFTAYSYFSTLLIGALAIFVFVLFFASHRLKTTWQENPPSARQRRLRQIFCTPRFWVGLLDRQNESRLSDNPIGWLQQYSWTARTSKWGWCFVIITFVSWLLANEYRFLSAGLAWLKTAVLISVAFSAVGSFQREKQNGALELLLVTPLRERQIIAGRLWGIWGQFFPGYSILLLTAVSVSVYFPYFGSPMGGANFLTWVCEFLVVPMVGLYFAMRMKNFIVAWLLTCFWTLYLPGVVLTVMFRIYFGFGLSSIEGNGNLSEMVLLAIMGWVAISRLHRRLQGRSFVVTGATPSNLS